MSAIPQATSRLSLRAGFPEKREKWRTPPLVLGASEKSATRRGIGGVYHSVGQNYLQSYLNEYSFRYNRRFDVQPMFLSFLQQVEKRDAVVRHTPVLAEPF